MRYQQCRHTEGHKIEKTGVLVDHHDCDYVEERNKLIPAAERKVAIQLAAMPSGPAKDWAFSRAFLAEMNKLAKEQGLT